MLCADGLLEDVQKARQNLTTQLEALVQND